MMTTNAYEIIRTRARRYLYRGKYPQVHVFTKSVTELDMLSRTFGGHSYLHGSGYTWVISKRTEMAALVAQMQPYLPSESHFEDLILSK